MHLGLTYEKRGPTGSRLREIDPPAPIKVSFSCRAPTR